MIPLPEFLATADPTPHWLITPYLPRGGIVFLHGKTSIGKSPLVWEMARCLSLGIPWFGHETVKARVLFLEFDGPLHLLRPRLRALPEPQGDWMLDGMYGGGVDMASLSSKAVARLRGAHTAYQPEAVIWNVLRSLTRADLSLGGTVATVYQNMAALFPLACHVVVAHNRKDQADGPIDTDEDFSGSGGWRDTATIALHLRQRGDSKGGHLSLEMTKSQVSARTKPLWLELGADGTTWVNGNRAPEILVRYAQVSSRYPTMTLRVESIMRELKVSRSTVFRALRERGIKG